MITGRRGMDVVGGVGRDCLIEFMDGRVVLMAISEGMMRSEGDRL